MHLAHLSWHRNMCHPYYFPARENYIFDNYNEKKLLHTTGLSWNKRRIPYAVFK